MLHSRCTSRLHCTACGEPVPRFLLCACRASRCVHYPAKRKKDKRQKQTHKIFPTRSHHGVAQKVHEQVHHTGRDLWELDCTAVDGRNQHLHRVFLEGGEQMEEGGGEGGEDGRGHTEAQAVTVDLMASQHNQVQASRAVKAQALWCWVVWLCSAVRCATTSEIPPNPPKN